ncbi:hypothetical protein WME91_03030 [Sorangium sp. So ce269]
MISSVVFQEGRIAYWAKWHSVAYGTRSGDRVEVARRGGTNALPWIPWVLETIDDSLWRLHGLSIAIGKQDGAEFVAYVDAELGLLKVARRVGGNAGTCSGSSQWDCETVASANAIRSPSIAVSFDTTIQDHVVHVIYTVETNAGSRSLKYAQKIGGNPWSTGTIKASTNLIRLTSDAIALEGTTPFVAYGEPSVGVQVSRLAGPSLSNWATTVVDPNGGESVCMDIRSSRREIAHASGTSGNYSLKSASWSAGLWTLSTVDTSVGPFASVVLDDALEPHIGYRKGGAPWRAKLAGGAWSTVGTIIPPAAGWNPTIQVDPRTAPDKAMLVHMDDIGMLHVTEE